MIRSTPIPHNAESPARASTGFCREDQAHDRTSPSDRLPRLFAVGGLLALPLILAALPAHAQAPCGPRLAVLQMAADNGLTIRWRSTVDTRQMIEAFASDLTGRWVVFGATPDGLMCVIASGDAFQVFAAPLPGVPG